MGKTDILMPQRSLIVPVPKPGKKSAIVLCAEHRLISTARNRTVGCILSSLEISRLLVLDMRVNMRKNNW